uniref:Gametogenetin n=1 Tax=Pithovirus LCPAC403 TaxID=2506596 RepID=A0A481ZBV9_9VIRU|nr:MAG: gametogenetin [Pithovirus LCPAC403]
MPSKCGVNTDDGTPCTTHVKVSGTKCSKHNDSIRCIVITKKNVQCKNNGINGTKYCSAHKIQNPEHKLFVCTANTKRGNPCPYEAKMKDGLCTLHMNEKTITEKKCTACEKIKPLKDYYKKPQGRGGVAAKCKECINSARKRLNYPRKQHDTKRCSKCKKDINVSLFTSRRRNKDGLADYCKDCYKARDTYPRQEKGKKECITCKLIKDVSMFGTYSIELSGLNSKCKVCRAEYRSERLSKLDNFIGYLYASSKSNAKKRRLGHNIAKDDIMKLWEEEKKTCVGTGFTMTHIKTPPDFCRISLPHYYNMSIDRINSNLGYIKENIQLCTLGYNQIKGNLDEEFIHDMARNIAEYDGTVNKVIITSIVEEFIRIKFNETSKNCYRNSRTIGLNITPRDLYAMYIKQGGLCTLSGRPMTFYTSSRFRLLEGHKHRREENYYNLSIDRINSLKDYTVDNIQLVCSCVNMMKWEMPQDMFIDFCRAIANTYPYPYE